MTTWVPGDVVTSTWLNSVEKVLALGTFGATTSPRVTIAPNTTYDLATNLVATTIQFNGSTSSSGAQQSELLSFRSITSDHSGTGFSTMIYFDHQVNSLAATASAYGIIGNVTGNAGSGKVNPLYVRAVAKGTFTGACDAIQVGITYDTGSAVNANSAVITIERSGSNVNSFPMGISFMSNTAGSKLSNGIVILDSLLITTSVLQWNQRAGSAAYFLAEIDSTSALIFSVDVNANIAWIKNGVQLTNNGVNVIQSYTTGDVKIGKASQATGDTTGRVFIPSVAGAPTGVPTDYTGVGYNPIVFDRTNNKIYVYSGGWKATAALT